MLLLLCALGAQAVAASPAPGVQEQVKPAAPQPEAAKAEARKPEGVQAGMTVAIPSLPPKEKLTPLEAKLDPQLRALTRAAKSTDPALLSKTAHDQAIALQEDRVAVKIVARLDRDLAGLKRKVIKLGGEITSTFQNSLFATLPVRQIEAMAKEAKVLRLSTDLPADIKNPGKK